MSAGHRGREKQGMAWHSSLILQGTGAARSSERDRSKASQERGRLWLGELGGTHSPDERNCSSMLQWRQGRSEAFRPNHPEESGVKVRAEVKNQA